MPASARALTPDPAFPGDQNGEADTADSHTGGIGRPDPAHPASPNGPRGGPASCIVVEMPEPADAVEEVVVHEPVDLQRSRLLLTWLRARRALDLCLSELLAAGPAGEQRVRGRLALVDDLENRARQAFVAYRAAAGEPSTATEPHAEPVVAEMWSGVSGGSPRHLR